MPWDEEKQCHSMVEVCNRHFGGAMMDCCNDCDTECLARQKKARDWDNRKDAVMLGVPVFIMIAVLLYGIWD